MHDAPFTSLWPDLRYGWRMIAKSPGFSAVAVLVLGLGIGASVAMFSTIDAALIRPLPFADPDRLVMGRATFGGQLNPWASAPDYEDYRDQARAFEDLAAILPFPINSTETGGEVAERIAGTVVSVNLFSTLGVSPALGRQFSDEDGSAGAPDVVLISHGYWQRRFGGSPRAAGATLIVDGAPATVVGVMPAGFRFLPGVDFWRPMRQDRDAAWLRDRHNWLLIGRLRESLSQQQAQREADAISARLEAAYPETNTGKALLVTDLHGVLVGDYTTRLLLLTAAVALVFLIACANVAGMLLSRAPARRLELSVRAALGASRSRLMGQLIAETLLLAGAAGILGTMLAAWLQQVIVALLKMELPGLQDGGIAASVLLFAVGLSVAAGILAGVYPAISSARANLAQDLRAASGRLGGPGIRFRSGLIVAQVTVSVVLLIVSVLLVRSLAMVRAVDPGFEPANVLTADIELPGDTYADQARQIQFFSELLEGVRASPGVVSAGVINALPIREPRNVFHVHVPDNPEEESSVFLRSVLPGYFATMRIPLLSGRDVGTTDAGDAPNEVVISRRAAERLSPDRSPLGREIVLDFFGQPRTLRVVGVAGDVRMGGLESDPGLAVYVPYDQIPYLAMRLAARTSGEPGTVAGAVRDLVLHLDRSVPVAGVTTMERVVADSMSDRKVTAIAMALYAILPLVMAAAGLYAVLSYYVTQRRHEIGIRMALGADVRDLIRMVMGRATYLVSAGLILGGVAALGATRLLRQALFGVGPTDAATFVLVGLLVASVALVASLVPTLRAARVDPSVALQAE